jgi:hypothetical protein
MKAALAAVALLALAAHAASVSHAAALCCPRCAARAWKIAPGRPARAAPSRWYLTIPVTRAPQAPKHADQWVLARHPSLRARADNVPADVRAKLVAKGLGGDLTVGRA